MPRPSRTFAFGASPKAAYYSLSACYLKTFWQPWYSRIWRGKWKWICRLGRWVHEFVVKRSKLTLYLYWNYLWLYLSTNGWTGKYGYLFFSSLAIVPREKNWLLVGFQNWPECVDFKLLLPLQSSSSKTNSSKFQTRGEVDNVRVVHACIIKKR